MLAMGGNMAIFKLCNVFLLPCNVFNCRVPLIIALSLTTKTYFFIRLRYLFYALFDTRNFDNFHCAFLNIAAMLGFRAHMLTSINQSKAVC